jgi:8-oxo-dGTP pyrophosphatase MutT (NUDIX family)
MAAEWSEIDTTKASGVAVRPAATVALLRDTPTGLEVLMVRRAATLEFHGGAWVFPGGRIDDADRAAGDDDVVAARRAAARETLEEAGVVVSPDEFVHIANWTTPEFMPKRFATWFFAAAVGEHADARADGVESDDLAWWKPGDALAARDRREIDLGPPQYVTCCQLARFATVADALTTMESEGPFDFRPRFVDDARGAVCTYEGDVAYDAPELVDAEGPHHRLVMPRAAEWRYVRSD